MTRRDWTTGNSIRIPKDDKEEVKEQRSKPSERKEIARHMFSISSTPAEKHIFQGLKTSLKEALVRSIRFDFCKNRDEEGRWVYSNDEIAEKYNLKPSTLEYIKRTYKVNPRSASARKNKNVKTKIKAAVEEMPKGTELNINGLLKQAEEYPDLIDVVNTAIERMEAGKYVGVVFSFLPEREVEFRHQISLGYKRPTRED